MHHHDDFDDFLERLPPMTEAERHEILLNYFNALIKPIDTPTLLALRAHLLPSVEADPEEAIGIEVLDGLLALREMGGD